MLKKLSTALALGLVVALLSIPAASFASRTDDNNGDRDRDGSCGSECDGPPWLLDAITTEGNFDVAKRAGDDPGCESADPDGSPWWMEEIGA